MATLGLGAYSSSDSEDDSGRATLATGEEAAPPAGPSTAAKAPARADANRPIDRTGGAALGDQMSAFDRGNRKRARHRKGGLPLFSRPLGARGDSDSDEEDDKAVKRRGAAKKFAGSLSFLPEPQNPIPVRDEPVPDPSNPPTTISAMGNSSMADTTTIELFPTAETAEMYRMQDGAEIASQADPAQNRDKAVTPEELLAQTLQAGQHVEFKEIKADVIQQAAPHEKSEIEALRVAMGSDHAKELSSATASATGPSKRHRQKHQITSLYHHAKATELQDMQRKQATGRSKAATQAKYGW